jgi:hypothetical protein
VNTARSVITTSAATGRSFLHVRRWLVSLIVGATLSFGFVTPALAAGGPPIGPVYDCYGYSTYAVITYFGALQLKSPTTYLTAPTRKGNSLSGTIVKGTYTLRGTKLIFQTGTYGKIHWSGLWTLKTTGTYTDPRHIGMFTPKGQEPLECYPWPH